METMFESAKNCKDYLNICRKSLDDTTYVMNFNDSTLIPANYFCHFDYKGVFWAKWSATANFTTVINSTATPE